MNIAIFEILDAGADVLLVRGAVDGQDLEARGWISATTNHFDAPRTDKSAPRAMTSAEVRAYCESLLASAAAPTPASPRALALCALDERPAPAAEPPNDRSAP